MSIKKKASPLPHHSQVKLSQEQTTHLEELMARLAERNPSWNLDPKDAKSIFPYFVAQKLFYLYDDETFELLTPVDTHLTGKSEELLDHYLILDTGEEVQLKLFQFKFREKYDGGISTKELFAFVERMNKVFLRGDLLDDEVLEAYKEVRDAFEKARKANPKARMRVNCYFVVNGQNATISDADKVEQIRTAFLGDRQAYGFTFETYGGLDIYNLAVDGRVPIQKEVLELELPGENTFIHWNIGKNPTGMPIQVVQGFVNVNQLIRLVDRYSNNELFERNVRLFLGVKKEVNRRIIETVTGTKSNWFGFMNNGVSITADDVIVNRPPSGKKLSVVLDNMQIINGCQTVNALYHAKYDPKLKDTFQGNSNVLVRIYHIDPANHEFMKELIIATNSQNAIRAEDLVANDQPQLDLENEFRQWGIAYERKDGARNGARFLYAITKESAAMAFMAVYWDLFTSKLRNSASRREVFSRGDEYGYIFSWGEDEPEETPFHAADVSERAVQILAASRLEATVRQQIADSTQDRKKRGALRKAAYFLARGVYLLNQKDILDTLHNTITSGLTQASVKSLAENMDSVAVKSFSKLVAAFEQSVEAYIKERGGDADAAFKNTKFAKQFEETVKRLPH